MGECYTTEAERSTRLLRAGIALLPETRVPLEAGQQLDADAIADLAYLDGGDFE
jgi:hypothetical protein